MLHPASYAEIEFESKIAEDAMNDLIAELNNLRNEPSPSPSLRWRDSTWPATPQTTSDWTSGYGNTEQGTEDTASPILEADIISADETSPASPQDTTTDQ